MTVYVDPAVHPFGRMVMAHMWSDAGEDELMAMADAIGVARKWRQEPRKGWVHFDICKSKRALAVSLGAVETDKYGPVEFMARLEGNESALARVARARAIAAGTPSQSGNGDEAGQGRAPLPSSCPPAQGKDMAR